jgi:hypothetical protein
MGNTLSTTNQPMDMKSLSSQIDDIAIHYILKQNTIDLLRLTDKEYYDNLILLVGNLFEKKLSDLEMGSMHQRIFPETVKDAVLDFLPSNGKLKDVMVRNISKFYMKIMMIFSAIVATIDPQYSYEDDQGAKQLFYLKDLNSYKNIPRHVQPLVHQLTNPMNLCRKRISILRNKIDVSDPDFITISPGERLCSTEGTSYLTDEIGIKELDLLYYDIFDPSSKTWKSRSKEMEKKYKEDLFKFYTIFTGQDTMPSDIRTFKDIELFDYRSLGYCKDTLFTQDYVVPKDDVLVVKYKEQLDMLEKSTVLYRSELLEHLKTLFLTRIEGDNMSYTIDPSLTMDKILKIESDTRDTIINLYTNCEQYFIRALLIFEELYDNQSKQMNEYRLTNLPLYKENLFSVNQPPNSFNMTVKPQNFSIPEIPTITETNRFSSLNTSNASSPESIPVLGAPFSLPVPIPYTIPAPEPSSNPNLSVPVVETVPSTAPMPYTAPYNAPSPYTAPIESTSNTPMPSIEPAPTEPAIVSTEPSIEPVPFTLPAPSIAPTEPAIVSTEPAFVSTEPAFVSTEPAIAPSEPVPFTLPAPSIAPTLASSVAPTEPVPFTLPAPSIAPTLASSVAPTEPAIEPAPIPFVESSIASIEPVTYNGSTEPSVTYNIPIESTNGSTEPSVTYNIPTIPKSNIPIESTNVSTVPVTNTLAPTPFTVTPAPAPVTASPVTEKKESNSIIESITNFINAKR